MAFIEANKFFGRWESDFKVSLYTYNFCYSSNYSRIMTNSNYSSCYNSSIFNLQFLFISYNCLLASAYNFAITGIKVKLVSFYSKISTSNHMFWKAIWNQLPECVFENFEISKFLKIWEGDLSLKSPEVSMLLLVITPNQQTLCGQLQISEQAITK